MASMSRVFFLLAFVVAAVAEEAEVIAEVPQVTSQEESTAVAVGVPEAEVEEVAIEEGNLRGSNLDAYSFVQASATGRCSGVDEKSYRFTKSMQTCALRTGAAQPAAGGCMSRELGVSSGCGYCLGNLIQCGRDNCIQKCCTGQCSNSWGCKNCLRTSCEPGFKACDR
eukprot:CAMPEP_0194747714 /NCGR_PEP_ID=MMETSP0323_2-20130528/1876_1 /TAXON_ID=2866 ORGANISM="Crypthecodinium cohnii, Strain Seligo" /NCGR_SAMPLE_ID=MMETSP0323_2 /ASSEMBLY_ACC=CAM_ASM_000346 /LENGTH=167 /DNA_ID=CAMNT_0039661385 /DNA_START=65 /DNA_END=568 /DNA_ORIENTATION=-